MAQEMFLNIINGVLSLSTLGSLYIAYKSLQLAKNYNEKQLDLQSLPYLHLNMYDKKGLHFELVNSSQTPAFDIDIYILSIISEEILSINNLIKNHLISKYEYKITSDKEKFYYIYDRVVYSLAPINKYVITPIRHLRNINSGQYYIFLQYKNPFGKNYSQLYWFTKSLDNYSKNKTLKLSYLDPPTISETKRIEIEIKDDWKKNRNIGFPLKFVSSYSSKNRPKYISNFLSMMNHAFSSGYIKNQSLFQVEDRGLWRPI